MAYDALNMGKDWRNKGPSSIERVGKLPLRMKPPRLISYSLVKRLFEQRSYSAVSLGLGLVAVWPLFVMSDGLEFLRC